MLFHSTESETDAGVGVGVYMETELPIVVLPPDREETARRTRDLLARAGVPMIRVAGPPGAGKTELIAATARRLAGRRRVGVVVSHPAADRDVEQLRAACWRVAAVDAPVPEPADVAAAVRAVGVTDVDLILVEACGGIAPFPDVGEDATVAVLGVSCGDDKAAEYRSLVARASLVLLTKTDLMQYVRFDPAVFRADVDRLNPAAAVVELSIADGHHLGHWLRWLEARVEAKRPAGREAGRCEPEWFFG